MQVRTQRYAIKQLVILVYASFFGVALLLGGCGAQKADTKPGSDENDTTVATSREDVNVDRSEDDGRVEDVSEGTALDARANPEVTRDPSVLPPGSELNVPRTARVQTTPFKVEAMTKDSPEGEHAEDSPVAERGVRAMGAESDALEERTGTAAPQSRASRTDSASAPTVPSYDPVTVFYATDRQALDSSAGTISTRMELIFLAATASITLLLMLLCCFGWRRRLTLGLTVVGLLATLTLGVQWGLASWSHVRQIADPGVRYGNERGTLVYGTCDVTIPASHASGEIERPSILRLEVREDVAKHVVLLATEPRGADDFFLQLRTTVEAADRSEVFVFVHGYNVTFDGAARRTAQIAHDVGFAGARIFFSWPSQGGLLKYTVDENNVEWAVPHLKQFLIDVTRRSGAQSVNLIAHSMGNQALTAALRELQRQLGEETALFNQIILAAPDVDAEIFRRDLAPALVQSARRVTLYASSTDQALLASKKVHGHARAGDSGEGLVVLPGIETIDVSTLDTSLLGHSYYGSSDPILLDIRRMIHDALPAAQHPFLLPRSYGGLTYWVFKKMRTTATREVPQLQ